MNITLIIVGQLHKITNYHVVYNSHAFVILMILLACSHIHHHHHHHRFVASPEFKILIQSLFFKKCAKARKELAFPAILKKP